MDDDPLSQAVAEELDHHLSEGNPIPSRGVRNIYLEDNHRRALWEHVSERPCVLLECGFVTNEKDCVILASQPGQDVIALKLALGLDAFFAPTPDYDDNGVGGGSGDG